jgi:hypothetical protein
MTPDERHPPDLDRTREALRAHDELLAEQDEEPETPPADDGDEEPETPPADDGDEVPETPPADEEPETG